MEYNSHVYWPWPDGDQDGFSCKCNFTITKKAMCKTKEDANRIEEIYDRLRSENFGQVLLPAFKYTRDSDTEVTLQQQFIKGVPVGTLVKRFSDIVYKEVVEKKGDWTFVDYSTFNFIVEEETNKIYAIDFLSYANDSGEPWGSRKDRWDMYQTHHKDKMKALGI